MEALEKGTVPEKVFLQRDLRGDNFNRLFSAIRKKQVPYQMVPVEKLNRITRNNHQGVIALISLLEYQPLQALIPMIMETGETPMLVVADGITDVRNLGALARSAECAGAHGLIIPQKGVATINAEAIKASAGALSRIPVCREENIMESLLFLKECGIHVVALDEKGSQTIYGCDLTLPTAIIVGSEEKGVSKALLRLSDQVVAIPMKGKIASLNVSVATGVALFEATRQRDHL